MKRLMIFVIVILSSCAEYIRPSSIDTYVNYPVSCIDNCSIEMSRALIWISNQQGIKVSVANDSIIQTDGVTKDSYSLNYTIVKTGSTLIINTSCPNIYGCAQDFGQMIDSLKLAIAGNK